MALPTPEFPEYVKPEVTNVINTSFNEKVFNPIAYGRYFEIIFNEQALFRNQLLRSRALVPSSGIRALFSEQTGSYYARIPIYGRIGTEKESDAPVNYDGMTDIDRAKTFTYERGVTCFGRAKAWFELDFTYDITMGIDFLSYTAQQIAFYWERQDIKTLYAIMNALFKKKEIPTTTPVEQEPAIHWNEFVEYHTYDTTRIQIEDLLVNQFSTVSLTTVDVSTLGTEVQTRLADAELKKTFKDSIKLGVETLNNAIQRASGDNKNIFTLVIAPSIIGTILENKQLLEYFKYNDAMGIQRSLNMGSWNGRTVLLDDELLSESLNLATPLEETYVMDVYNTNDSKTYSVTFSIKSTRAPIPFLVLGQGMFEYEMLDVKTPWEMFREPLTNGGVSTLISRRRLLYAPKGFSYTPNNQATLSPTNEELGNELNWELVRSAKPYIIYNKDGQTVKETHYDFYAHRNIPLLKVLVGDNSRGLEDLTIKVTKVQEKT